VANADVTVMSYLRRERAEKGHRGDSKPRRIMA